MALEIWMSEQDRSGTDWSPTFAVPAGQARLFVKINVPGWLASFQAARFAVEASYNGPQGPFADAGSVMVQGGPATNRQGEPITFRSFTSEFNPAAYPTHVRVRHEIAGTVYVGLECEFQAPA
jgi:hypothetical protein